MFGTGGSPSVNQTLGQASINLTTSWTKFTLTFDVPSLSGKVLGSNGDDSIAVAFLSYKQDNTIYNDTLGAVGSWSTSAYLDVAQVQLEEGTVASQFEYRPTTIEMHLCQRYYQVARFFFGTGLASNYGGHSMLLPVTMRTNPSVAYTDDVGAVNKITTNGGGNGQTITGGSIGAAQYYMTFDLLYSGTTGNWVAGFVQLSADL
jgi:hypothetical protein